MSQNSPNLELPFLQPSQAQKHVTHNEALRRLDLLVQLRLQQTGATTPPGAAQEGEIHALGVGANGAWAGQDNMLAAWLDGVWQFIAPQPGWRGWDIAAARAVVWQNDAWQVPHPELDNLDGVGIGTGSDATNRLSVQSPAALFSHVGSDHRLTVNKAATPDTASLMFQSGWSGRAEMGLAGQDDFSIKVSADGSNWTEALRLGGDGLASGSAVQTDSVDAGAGRLMAVGAFGLGESGAAAEIPDLGSAATPAGCYRVTTGTPGAAALPASLQGGDGLVRVERHDGDRLRQTAWRLPFQGGVWTRAHSGGNWGSWRLIYDHTSVLGPVSQSGGIPTGALIEQGSGGNGSWLRLADGTQICTQTFNSAAASHGWSFPVAFASGTTPTLQALARHASAPRIVTEGGDLSDTGVTLHVWDTSDTAAAAAIHATATGRWF